MKYLILATLVCSSSVLTADEPISRAPTLGTIQTLLIPGFNTKLTIDEQSINEITESINNTLVALVATADFQTLTNRAAIIPIFRALVMYDMTQAQWGQTDRVSVVYSMFIEKLVTTNPHTNFPIGSRVLLRGQATAAENGLYIVQSDYTLVRDTTQENRFVTHLGYGLVMSLINPLQACFYYPPAHSFVDVGEIPEAAS